MNEELRAQHFERVTDEKARKVYDYLCDACDRRSGGMTDPDQMLVSDIAFAEQIKGLLMDDIAVRGIGKEARNGRQTYWQANRSLSDLRSWSDQQRKHLNELKLTPIRRDVAAVEINDDFDNFE